MAFGERFSFLMGISMGKWPNFEYHVGKLLEYDRSCYITHITHPWGPPWTLETLGDHWRPCLKITNLGVRLVRFPNPLASGRYMTILAIFRHFQACRQGSPRVAKGFQGPRGTPGMGEMGVITRSIIFKSFSYMIFKIGPFPH